MDSGQNLINLKKLSNFNKPSQLNAAIHKSNTTPVLPQTDISASLAPPPLDETLTVEERLKQIQCCLEKESSVMVTYDFIQLYKTLLLACELAMCGTFEDPKVGQNREMSMPSIFSILEITDESDRVGCLTTFSYLSFNRLHVGFWIQAPKNAPSTTWCPASLLRISRCLRELVPVRVCRV